MAECPIHTKQYQPDLLTKIMQLNSAGISVAFLETKTDIDHPRVMRIRLWDHERDRKCEYRLLGSDFAIMEALPARMVDLLDTMHRNYLYKQ